MVINLKNELPYTQWDNGKSFTEYGGYRILPLKSPPTQTALVEKNRDILNSEGLWKNDPYGTDTAPEWTKTRAVQGDELGDYLTAYNPLFVQGNKGMDYMIHNLLDVIKLREVL